ncbi:MAG: hypothetical protein AAB417_00480 [Patescibacteria group bacterium]
MLSKWVDRRVGKAESAVTEETAKERRQGGIAWVVALGYILTGILLTIVVFVVAITKGDIESAIKAVPVLAGYWGSAMGFVMGYYFRQDTQGG